LPEQGVQVRDMVGANSHAAHGVNSVIPSVGHALPAGHWVQPVALLEAW